MTLVLDTGALIAVERVDRATLTLMEAARREGHSLVVPAGVLAQAWRGGSRQARLARFLAARGVDVEVLTDPVARAAGIVCGHAGTADIVDASVVVAARRRRAAIVSSDRADLELLDPGIAVLDC
ncbi:MAG: PIN domain-containing protein [Acidimicrobiales bacterium]